MEMKPLGLSVIDSSVKLLMISFLCVFCLSGKAHAQVTFLSDYEPNAVVVPAAKPLARAEIRPIAVSSAPRAPSVKPFARRDVKVSAPVRQVIAPSRPLGRGALVPDHGKEKSARAAVVAECRRVSRLGLAYHFGSNDPSTGGLDCSGTVQYILQSIANGSVPRTASAQYTWLKEWGSLNEEGSAPGADAIFAKLRPGDLLFWKGTYVTNRYPDVSHVMIYLGRDPATGVPLMFGASSSKRRGWNGSAVDIYEFNPMKPGKSQFLGFGSPPMLGS
jgi:cell wall-associated NlpC family hydrolase